MRNRKRLVIWLVVGVIVVGAVIYSVSANRMADLDYSGRIASRSFESAFPEVVRHSRGNGAEAIFNGDTVKSECYLNPGQAHGLEPRFVNIGKSPVMIYKGESGVFYILGTVRVLRYDRLNHSWLNDGVVTSRKYVYQPVGQR